MLTSCICLFHYTATAKTAVVKMNKLDLWLNLLTQDDKLSGKSTLEVTVSGAALIKTHFNLIITWHTPG